MRRELAQHRLPDLAQNIKRPLNMFLLRPLGTHDEPDAHFTIQVRARQEQHVGVLVVVAVVFVFFGWAAALCETAVELHIEFVERLEVCGPCEGGWAWVWDWDDEAEDCEREGARGYDLKDGGLNEEVME